MKITLIQMDVKIADKVADRELNFARVRTLINSFKEQKSIIFDKQEPNVILLPEALDIGFDTSKFSVFADADAAKTSKFLSELSAVKNALLIGGSINRRDDKIYNSALVFDRGTQILCYDKIHTFSLAGEGNIVTAGRSLGFCKIKFNSLFIKIGVAICYDIRFGEIFRALSLYGARVIFVIAQFPIERVDHFITLARARAIENGVFICALNGCGEFIDQRGEVKRFGGNSIIVSPEGEILTHLGESEEIRTVQIDLTAVDRYRAHLDVLKDLRPEIYKEF